MAITDIIEESSMIETGAPSIKYEGERPLKKQEMLMAGPDWYIKRMELLMDEYGYDYDEAGEIAYDSDKYYEVIGIDPGGIGDESRIMDEEVVEEGIMRAANGGMAIQSGVKNYEPSKMVSVPKEFRARKNSPNTHLAYITDDEAGILKALKPDTPHKGPRGIPNYDSFDAAGGYSNPDTGYSASAGGAGGGWQDSSRQDKEINQRWEKASDQQKQTWNPQQEQIKLKQQQDKLKADLEKQKQDEKNQKQITDAWKAKEAKQKKLKDFSWVKDSYIDEDDEVENFGFDEWDTNRDGKIGLGERIDRHNYNKRKDRQKKLQDRRDQKIRAGFDLVNPDVNLTRTIKEQEMYGDVKGDKTYKDMVTAAIMGDTYTGTGGISPTSFEKYTPKKGGSHEKYDYTPDFFTPIKTNVPNALVQGATGIANALGGALSNKVPYEQQMLNLVDEYDRLGNLDLRETNIDKMDKEFAPNEWARRNDMIYNPITKTFEKDHSKEDRPNQDPCKGPNPPPYCFVGGKNQTDDDEEEDDWMLGLAFRKDGGRVPAAYGGIMDKYTGRRAYGLGSIFKKAKKIFKSPLGKAALLGLGGWKAGLFSGLGGGGGFLSSLKNMSLGKKAALTLGGGALAGILAGQEYEDEDGDGYDDKTGLDINKLKSDPYGQLRGRFDYKTGGEAIADLSGDPEYKGWKMMYERNKDVASMHPKHSDFVKYYQNVDRSNKAEGGLMDMGGMEMDLRDEGGFVPIGKKERADDVPARLSKNEFVFTADAVRGAGDGDIDKGAEIMYNSMKKLEAENDQSQGLDGAREMFQTAKRLEEVL